MAEIAKTGNKEVDKAVEDALKSKGLEVTTTEKTTIAKTLISDEFSKHLTN